MRFYPNNNAYRIEFIALIYSTLTLLASVYLIVTGDNSYFWKAHLVFIGAFLITIFLTNALEVLITQLIGNFGGICLLLFLIYYLIMTLGYPDPQITSSHLYYFTRNIIPAFLIGFVLFGRIKTHRVSEFPHPSLLVRSIVLNGPMIASLLFYFLVIFSIFYTFWSIRRTDIFLIQNLAGLDYLYYQTFGRYILISFISALMILHYYLKQKRDYYKILCFIIFCLVFNVCISLALVGSNKELVILVWILFMCLIYAKPNKFLVKHKKIRLKNLFIVLLVLGACGMAWFYISSVELPYLRVFSFQSQTSIFKNLSITSRINILMDSGIDQLSINPIFGNLGAEYVVARSGEYIHSMISVQSHLGIIGSFLLVGYLISRLYRLYFNDGRSVLKMITPPIFIISFIGTFFTWFIFWFLIGALFAPRKDP